MSGILGTFKLDEIDLSTIIPADVLTVGEGMAMLLGFINSESTSDGFLVKSSLYGSLKRAAATFVGVPRDKHTDKVQFKSADGWKYVTADRPAPKNAETRTVTLHTHSSKAVREGIATLRTEYGVDMGRLAQKKSVDGTECVAVTLRKVDTVA